MLETTDLSSKLNDPSLLCTKAYINGEWVDADNGDTFEVTNPARGDVICSVPNMTAIESARAIDAAYSAQKAWAKRTGKDRAAVLRNGTT